MHCVAIPVNTSISFVHKLFTSRVLTSVLLCGIIYSWIYHKRKVVSTMENCELLVIFNDGEQKLFNDVEVYGHQGDSILFHNMSRRVEHDRL